MRVYVWIDRVKLEVSRSCAVVTPLGCKSQDLAAPNTQQGIRILTPHALNWAGVDRQSEGLSWLSVC